MIANFLNQIFGDSLGRKDYGFLRNHYQNMNPERLQVLPNVCGLYTMICLLQFGQKEDKGVHNVIVFSFIGRFL